MQFLSADREHREVELDTPRCTAVADSEFDRAAIAPAHGALPPW
jgi:hypothetical protein